MTDFFNEIDDTKNEVRESLRTDISAAINKVHYTQGVTYELATALACEAVVESYSRVGDRDNAGLARTLRWMADEIEAPVPEEDSDGLLYE
jgi:hypothetical protein